MQKTIFLLVLLMTMGGLFATALNEGFEGSTFPPAGWTLVNGGDTNTWIRTAASFYPRTGTFCTAISYNFTVAHDDWLISPQLTPTTGNFTFSFYSRNLNTAGTDRFNVKLSNATNATTDFTVNLASNIAPPTTYTLYSYNLSSYIGQKVFIAIQAITVNGASLLVDDVTGPDMSSFEDFETGNFNAFSWHNASPSPWTVQSSEKYAGTFAAKSGAIGDYESTSMSLYQYGAVAGTISFAQRVSSEFDYDYLKFYIDDIEKGSWSGAGSWTNQSYAVTAGNHTYRWTYSKDINTVSGSDCAWIDNIVFPNVILGTASAPYQITNPAELNNIRNFMGSTHANKYFKLMNDIDLTSYLAIGGAGYTAWGTAGWLPFGGSGTPFYGHFDGNNHKITGLKINRSGYYECAFWSYTAVGSTIENLRIEIAAGGSVYGYRRVGTFVGTNYGTLTNCSASGIVTGGLWTGLLVGWNEGGTVNRCFSSGSVQGSDNTVGGLVGQSNSIVSNSYSTAAVSGAHYIGGVVGYQGAGTITNCYATGLLSGGQRGGVCGASAGTVTNCYWDTQTTGMSTSYGGTGKTTAQMKLQSTFVPWDFAGETTNGTNDYWNISTSDNNGYPFLTWEHANELRQPQMTSPANLASALPKTGFNLTWTQNPVGLVPTSYTLYMILGNPGQLYNNGYTGQYRFTGLTGTSYNPVTQGGITFNNRDVWYWAVVACNANGEATPYPTARSFIIEKDPFATESFEVGNTAGSTSIFEWTQQLGSGSNYWTVNNNVSLTNISPRTGTYNLILAAIGNAWLFESIPLVEGVLYDVELYAKPYGYPAVNANIGIYYGSTGTIAGMTNTIVDQTTVTTNGYQRIYGSFTAPSTGTYYLGIHGIISNISYVSLDDIKISPRPVILSCSSANLDLSAAHVNTTSPNKNLIVTNTGGYTLNLAASDISLVGDDPTQFEFTTSTVFPAALTNGQSVTIPVGFHPTSIGEKSAILRIVYNGSNYEVALTGISISANALLESFEGAFPPFGWSSDYGWYTTTSQAYTGLKSLTRATSIYNEVSLETPYLALTGTSVLNFKTYFMHSSDEKIQIYYHDSNTSTWTPIGSEIDLTPNAWESHAISLTGLSGNYKLGFSAYLPTANYYNTVFLDCVYGPEITPPGQPTLLLPAIDATGVSEYPTVQWSASTTVGSVSGYKVFCDKNPNPTTLITPTLMTDLVYTFTTALDLSSDYYWKVVAYGAGADSTASEIRKFSTRLDPTIVEFPYLQTFLENEFPPYGWAKDSGYSWFCQGISNPNIVAQFKDHPSAVMDLDTPEINFGGVPGILSFEHAYAYNSLNPGNIDQLQIMYSTDGGSNFAPLITYAGGENGTLNTAPAVTGYYWPRIGEWALKTVNLPIGTNKVRFRGISGDGNHLWMDNIGLNLLTFASGTGTEMDPYQITSPAELDLMHFYIGDTYADKYFKLMNDIDLSAYLTAGGVGYNQWGTAGWLPIGTEDTPFYGHFDGNNKVISGLSIDRPDLSVVGFFGHSGMESIIQNLGIEIASTGFVKGKEWTGGLVGWNDGDISNCFVRGSVKGNLSYGEVVGGLVGTTQGTINRCFSTGNIEGTNYIGGLVGDNQNTIINSYSTAAVSAVNIAGGLAGFNYITINCYATGSITCSGSKGGLIADSYGPVVNSYWDTETTGVSTSSGSDPSFGKTTAQMKTQSTFTDWDFDTIWFISPTVNNGYPQLRWTTGEIPALPVPTNIVIQPGTVSGTITLSWDDMSASWYGVYGGTSPTNLTYLGWSATNSITVTADNLGFFKITAGSGTPTAPALLRSISK